MDPELLINSPESDEDLFDIGYPPSTGQQSDLSQASERSRVRSAISVPHTSRHRSHSSSPQRDTSNSRQVPGFVYSASEGKQPGPQQAQPAPISPPPAACLIRSPRPLAAAHLTRLSDRAALRNGARTQELHSSHSNTTHPASLLSLSPFPCVPRLAPADSASPTVFSHHIQLNPQLELLSHASREAILNSLAPSTLSAYLTGWNGFKAYHGAYQLPFPTLDVISVCNFITHAHSIPTSQCLSKAYVSRNPPSQPLHPFPTLRIVMVDLTLECMFLLAFFGFLRCSEFAPTSSAYNPHHHPSLSDISLHTNDSLIFTLRRSKTDQLGISFHIFRLNSYLSPYEPLTKYLSARYAAHATPQHPLFLTETGKMATRFWFQKHFHNVLLISGICSEHYSSHSFRIGAASTAAKLSISDQTIQAHAQLSSI
ncbi:Protein kinase C-like [Dissostichus eleginoides]|uniref:Protein kinase C-like n=1 Tax=Dissostichus eleginoides TaxID=100907 RepID=A0AAD9BEN3_DISEL|nr:Protein kinase C-like [Dissostichus eleginoides]